LATRIKFDMLPPHALPRSATASFTGNWSREVEDESFLADVVARWRSQALGAIDQQPSAQPQSLAALLRQLRQANSE
jgi:hypothetical protein